MAPTTPPATGKKQRVQVKVFDVETGEERYSSESIIVNGPGQFCIHYCCSCSNIIEAKQ
jgi:hypothetical protein